MTMNETAPAQRPSEAVQQSQNFAFPIFPTVCYRREHPELRESINKELAAIVLRQEKEEESLTSNGVSIKNGYHSNVKFFEKKDAAVQQLKQVILNDFSDYVQHFWKHESRKPLEQSQPLNTVMWGWSVLMREGAHSNMHLHVRSNLSGVYYVQTPNEKEILSGANDKAGWLALSDPRAKAYVNTVPGQYRTITVPPVPGSLVMFPSYLEHFVTPFKGEGERISIAFNFRFINNELEM